MPRSRKYKGRFFLRFLVSFVLVAIIPLLVIEYLYLSSIRTFSQPVLWQSRQIVHRLEKTLLRQKVFDVARELEIYFEQVSPGDVEKMKHDTRLRAIAVQPVSTITYTEVHTSNGKLVFGRSMALRDSSTQKARNEESGAWEILRKGSIRPAEGFFDWKKPDGQMVRKYMVSTPVKGTNLVVAAAASLEKMEAPMNRIGRAAREREKMMFLYLIAISVGFLIYLILISYLLSRRITRPIVHLADVVDRIGLGDLNVKIATKTRDELMVLIESIERMRKSLKSAIGYLREKQGTHDEGQDKK